ncbi:major histocompatibility complex class I-related gene protein-like isoform X2 [Megalops cyprinoides]|uniref:major histocompatibility complex class I-related gene protein-like isoform X2 n=1 Tax=Megalops cyprinoides TaxID=118141 RepID=UPI001864E748|nr:major histocompatibility complex class I-related gene protein-like isoform X2 [Megalops cyprinoides]
MQYVKPFVLFLCCTRAASSVTHSWKNCVTGTTGVSAFPDFVAVAIVDEDTVAYFDSNIKHIELRQQWAEKIEEKNMDRDNRELNSFMEDFKQKWSQYMTRFNQSGGIHTLQLEFGCQGDGWKHEGYLKYGYDGEDFLTLDMTTLTWIAANPQAAIIKKEWESSETKRHQMQKYFICLSLLQRAAIYGKNSLERKVPPEVSLLRRDPSSPVTCLATGFFPKGIVVSWQKDGEDLHEDVELGETVSNEDGTFQTRSRLTVSPADLKEHKFTCIVDHSSLEKNIIKPVTKEEIKTNLDLRNPAGGVDTFTSSQQTWVSLAVTRRHLSMVQRQCGGQGQGLEESLFIQTVRT